MIKYWFHLLKNRGNDLIGNTIVESLNVALSSNQHSWFTSATYLLRLAGINIGAMNTIEKAEQNRISSTLTNKLKQEYERIFFQSIRASEKLNTVYAKVKTSYKIKDYLNEIRYYKYRSAIAKMRISAHTMPIETGRWKGIPREERTCLKGLFHPAFLARVVSWFPFVVAIFMGHENGGKQRLAKRPHVQGMLDETDPLICDSKEAGDEAHYLARCNNPTLQTLRQPMIEESRNFASPTRTIFDLNLLKDFRKSDGPLRGKFLYSLLETIKGLETELALQTCQ